MLVVLWVATPLAGCPKGNEVADAAQRGSASNPCVSLDDDSLGERAPQRWPPVSVNEATFDVGDFPRIATRLAEDPRRATVVALCTSCHSARYIVAQPPLAADIWQAEITKMVEGYGAVVPDDKRADVLAYLVDHYGPSRREAPWVEAVQPVANSAPTVYKTYCMACHGADGQGVPGAFPPLARHAAALGQSAQGRAYMIDVVLHGVAGEIRVDGAAFNNAMPPLGGRLSDAEVAAVLDDVRRRWPGPAGDIVPITLGDVSAHRPDKSSEQVRQSRP